MTEILIYEFDGKAVELTPIVLKAKGKQDGGVWMHRWLAIELAAYFGINLKMWVLERIDYLFISAA